MENSIHTAGFYYTTEYYYYHCSAVGGSTTHVLLGSSGLDMPDLRWIRGTMPAAEEQAAGSVPCECGACLRPHHRRGLMSC